MSGEIGIPASDATSVGESIPLVEMQVGEAVLCIEHVGDVILASGGDIRPVALDPREAFERASDALRECAAVVGTRIQQIGAAVKPDEITIEFSLTFGVEAKTRIVPILVTSKSKANTGLKVTCRWDATKGVVDRGAAVEPGEEEEVDEPGGKDGGA